MLNSVKSATRAVYKYMLYILHTVPVVFSADSELIKNSLLLLLVQPDIQVVTRESESGESA